MSIVTAAMAGRTSSLETDSLALVLESKLTQNGMNLAALSLVSPVLLVFLRHSGCTFCREALSDLSASRNSIEALGTRIVVVHFGDPALLDGMLQKHGLDSLDRIRDDDQILYHAFGLKQGSWWQLAGPRVWWRGVRAGLIDGHGAGKAAGDFRQMPGMFLLENCEVVRSFRHESASDRPLYEAFVRTSLRLSRTRDRS
jgi:peroxiredoxin